MTRRDGNRVLSIRSEARFNSLSGWRLKAAMKP